VREQSYYYVFEGDGDFREKEVGNNSVNRMACDQKSITQIAAEGRAYHWNKEILTSNYRALDPENVIVKFGSDDQGSYQESSGDTYVQGCLNKSINDLYNEG